ncbi:phospho-sugar mutase [Hoyosella sp. YIM 151337]|uniref:phospho-sugar mutase n=1 Tax=Hoyosella sp. YIM 151337 TaxID=2992742 RepID=UPI002236024F|nr:phospho-sugar mutase [Hoyosella sp. YIM 151337]MCW4352368.1 phospho-sugar mutase [Hoyosella sp. YIM 151337]
MSPAAVTAWIDGDPDPASRAELLGLSAAELAERFSQHLRFGTAGIRGPVRAGPNGMNLAVVIRTTAGISSWLTRRCLGGSIVVVGRDARRGSEAFSRAAAEVLAAAGFRVVFLPRPLPTPVVAYSTRLLGAAAGIQITASHNPPGDNGYKVYLDGGAQLVAPADNEIEREIAAAPPAASVPRKPVEAADSQLVGKYLQRVAGLPKGQHRRLRIALTPMHGVGGEVALAALRDAGFTDVHTVREQFEPDPAFPTVAFPNPEEAGAADLLLALAADVGADIAIALDPDADRCAVGVPTENGWRMLTGDETGVLLGDYVLRHTAGDRLVATTIVSSSLLGRVAAAHGARYAETLTGFKWLVRAGDGLVYAYEEALGICADPDTVRDKDGISAAVLVADLAATLKAEGRTLTGALHGLMDVHGFHQTAQISRRFTDLTAISAAMQKLRHALPREIGGETITVNDLTAVRGPGRTDAIILRGEHLRVVVRPSGTEPKLKCYIEAAMDDNSAAAQEAAKTLISAATEFAAQL